MVSVCVLCRWLFIVCLVISDPMSPETPANKDIPRNPRSWRLFREWSVGATVSGVFSFWTSSADLLVKFLSLSFTRSFDPQWCAGVGGSILIMTFTLVVDVDRAIFPSLEMVMPSLMLHVFCSEHTRGMAVTTAMIIAARIKQMIVWRFMKGRCGLGTV